MAKAKSRHRRHLHRPVPSTLPHFIELAPSVMADLMSTFALSPVQAAAIVGNLGTESRNFTAYHEGDQAENKGGYGWVQWTGPRRVAFFAWADAQGLARDSAAASLGYLEFELQTSYQSAITVLKRQTKLSSATHQFMTHYERPGTPHEQDRQTHAVIALDAYNRAQSAQGAGH